jgi:hypothetical protein
MSSPSTSEVISLEVGRAARENDISYTSLIEFICEYRTLPEFQKVISEYQLEDIIYARANRRDRNRAATRSLGRA